MPIELCRRSTLLTLALIAISWLPISNAVNAASQPVNPLAGDGNARRPVNPLAGDNPLAAPGQPSAPPAEAPQPIHAPNPLTQSAETIVFRRAALHDNMFNCDAIRLLVPQGWKLEGQTIWRGHLVLPCTAYYRVSDPPTHRAFTLYPILVFTDGIRESAIQGSPMPSENGKLAARFAEGNYYLGNEIRRRVRGPGEYVQQILIPRLRRDVTNARVVSVEKVDDLTRTRPNAFPGVTTRHESARVRVEYTVSGDPVEEDFYVLLGWDVTPNITTGGVLTVNWGGEVVSYTAAKGQMNKAEPIFQTIEWSAAATAEIRNYSEQIAQFVNKQFQMQQDYVMNVAAIRHTLSNQLTESVLASARANREAMDRGMIAQDNVIRGVAAYQKPDGSHIEVPSGYNHAFINANDDLIVTNSHFAKPSTGNWTEIQRSP